MVDFPASYVRLPECIYCFNDMFWKILVLLSVPIPLHGFTIILCNSMHCTTCRNVCIRFSGCNPRISQPRFVARIPTIHRNHQKKTKKYAKNCHKNQGRLNGRIVFVFSHFAVAFHSNFPGKPQKFNIDTQNAYI